VCLSHPIYDLCDCATKEKKFQIRITFFSDTSTEDSYSHRRLLSGAAPSLSFLYCPASSLTTDPVPARMRLRMLWARIFCPLVQANALPGTTFADYWLDCFY